MKQAKRDKVAVVIAWRQGETDLARTVESAKESIGRFASVVTVEDTQAQGPGRTRHRGILASNSDVIVIADSHMRFQGRALRAMADHAAKHGGVVCCKTHHNEACDFSGTPYAGARIVYRAKDGRTYTSLAGKWARDAEAGPRGCVMGGCYAFRRDWYYSVGQPLAMLPGWGCDEEILSIASWLSGAMPVCLDVRVAHLYRPKPPWNVMAQEYAAVRSGRLALIHAVVTEVSARRELTEWQATCVPEGISSVVSPECEQVRLALLKQPRKWAEWRATVCEPDEYDGKQDRKPKPLDAPARRVHVANPVVSVPAIRCTHCGTGYDPMSIRILRTASYPNGRRSHKCGTCGNWFQTRVAL